MYPTLSYDEVCMSSSKRAVSGLSGTSTLASFQFLDSDVLLELVGALQPRSL
jgi:hypothetical protein